MQPEKQSIFNWDKILIQELIENEDSITSELAKVIFNKESTVQTQYMKSGHTREQQSLFALNKSLEKNSKRAALW